VIVGSTGGAPAHPSWYLNLVANPEVTVQVGAETFTARARTASGSERQRLWSMMAAIFQNYDAYQAKTEREIPVVVLDPI
jgi:deazaflavin-dependent oxidoreductase (nitroreductase family)